MPARLLVLAAVASSFAFVSTARAQEQPAPAPRLGFGGALSGGAQQGQTVILRGDAVAAYQLFGGFGVEGGLAVGTFLRPDKNKGSQGYLGGLDAGVRWSMSPARLRGLTVGAGATYFYINAGEKLIHSGGHSTIGPSSVMLRATAGFAFPSSESSTVLVKLDLGWWLMEGGDEFLPETVDPFPRPLSISLGLQFLYFP